MSTLHSREGIRDRLLTGSEARGTRQSVQNYIFLKSLFEFTVDIRLRQTDERAAMRRAMDVGLYLKHH